MNEVTRILNALEQQGTQATEDLLPAVYEELRKLARYKMAGEAPNHTLQPTALVHEAWLRLVAPGHQSWQNRAHFFSAAAEAMRRILIDNARRKRADCHGGKVEHLNLDSLDLAAAMADDQLLALHEALDRLGAHDSAKAQLVKLRFFVGLTIEEAADVLGLSAPTAKRHWTYARAWLFREMNKT